MTPATSPAAPRQAHGRKYDPDAIYRSYTLELARGRGALERAARTHGCKPQYVAKIRDARQTVDPLQYEPPPGGYAPPEPRELPTPMPTECQLDYVAFRSVLASYGPIVGIVEWKPVSPAERLAKHTRRANWSMGFVAVLIMALYGNAWFIGNVPAHLVLSAALLVFGHLAAGCQRVVREIGRG